MSTKRSHWAKNNPTAKLIQKLLDSDAHGPIAGAFIMNAIYAAADATADTDPASLPQDSLIHPESWVGVAKEIKAKIDEEQGHDSPQRSTH